MSCGIDCIKWILFIFNFILVLLGIVILAVGIFCKMSLEEAEGIQDVPAAISICFIVLGVIIFVIAFFGCCGAVRESHCMVVTYAVFLLIILVIQEALAIWVFVKKDDLKTDESKDVINHDFVNSFHKYWTSKKDKDYIDQIQSRLSCCGISGPNDYSTFLNGIIPSSCCHHRGSTAAVLPCTQLNAFKEGCSSTFVEAVINTSKMIGGILMGVGVSELVGVVFALCLAKSIRNDHRQGYGV